MAHPLHMIDASFEKADVQLTIVPLDSFEEPEVTADEFLEGEPPGPEPTLPPAPPRPAKKSRTGLLMAGALGGGVFLGGGAVGMITVVLAAVVAALFGAIAGVWMLWPTSTELAELEPEVAPVEVVEPAEEGIADDEVVVAPDARRAAPAPSTGGTDRAPTSDTPTPAPAAAPSTPTPTAPPAPTPEEEAAGPGDLVTVKVLTDPPAARLWVDGQDAGRSPAKLELEPGSHQLSIESGKAQGTWPIDAGLGDERFCFVAKGKKISISDCN